MFLFLFTFVTAKPAFPPYPLGRRTSGILGAGSRNPLFEFGFEDADDLPDGLLFQVGAPNEVVGRYFEDALGRIAADALQCVDYPLVYFVGELLQGPRPSSSTSR